MFGSWGNQPLPDFDDIQSFIQSFDEDEKLPEWLPILVDELLEFRDNAEVSNCKYRGCQLHAYFTCVECLFIPKKPVCLGSGTRTLGISLEILSQLAIPSCRRIQPLGKQT